MRVGTVGTARKKELLGGTKGEGGACSGGSSCGGGAASEKDDAKQGPAGAAAAALNERTGPGLGASMGLVASLNTACAWGCDISESCWRRPSPLEPKENLCAGRAGVVWEARQSRASVLPLPAAGPSPAAGGRPAPAGASNLAPGSMNVEGCGDRISLMGLMLVPREPNPGPAARVGVAGVEAGTASSRNLTSGGLNVIGDAGESGGHHISPVCGVLQGR